MSSNAVCPPAARQAVRGATTGGQHPTQANVADSTRIRADGRRALTLANVPPAPPTRNTPTEPPTAWPTLGYLLSRTVVDTAGCWRFLGTRDAKGYGRAGSHLAHRAIHRFLLGPIRDGHEVDHLCYVTCCINPAHLEAVTPQVNHERALAHRALLKAQRLAEPNTCGRSA